MSTSPLQLIVAEVSRLTPDVASFRLEHAAGLPLPAFTAGSHIDIHLPNDLIRQYSLCNHPGELDYYLIAVKREPQSRGGSEAMHNIAPGAALSVSTPRNNFPIAEEAQSHLLLAGGIGITPLLSIARNLLLRDKTFQLEYFTRSLEGTPFYEAIKRELGNRARFNIGFEPPEVKERLCRVLAARQAGMHLYVCGPSQFIDLAAEIASPTWPTETIHVERFSGQPLGPSEENRAFRVILAQSNRVYEVQADKSILDILVENRIPCDFSCREGICGSCMVAVLKGEVEHRDSYLSSAEKFGGKVMMICVSRAKRESLVIDI